MRFFGFVGIFTWIATHLAAQCPTVGFSVATNACINENVFITDTSIGDSLVWDFCSLDLEADPSFIISDDYTLLSSQPWGVETVFGLEWHTFIVNRGGGGILRLDHGSGLTNPPVMVDLGNPDGALNQPEHLSFLKVGTSWFAAVTQNLSSPNNSVLLLDFASTADGSIAWARSSQTS